MRNFLRHTLPGPALRFLLAGFTMLSLAGLAVAGDKNPVAQSPDPVPVLKSSPDKQSRPTDLDIEPDRFEFVRANLIATFYHELAHAMIDTMELPVLAQEEDAADVFSALMIEHLFDADAAHTIIMGALKAGEIDAAEWLQSGRSWDHADEHGHDLQRYYNLACLYYGADPENRADFAAAVNLPEDRANNCAGEYALAARSWGPIIDRLADNFAKNTADGTAITSGANAANGAAGRGLMSFSQSARTNMQQRAADVVNTEVARMNAGYHLPTSIRITVKRCKRNADFLAYYSPNRRKITLCTNYIDDLYRDAPQ